MEVGLAGAGWMNELMSTTIAERRPDDERTYGID